MNMQGNSGVEEREHWRARIKRALQELRSADDSVRGRASNNENGEDAAAESTDR